MSDSFTVKLFAGFGLALAVAVLVPRAGWGGAAPPVGALLAAWSSSSRRACRC